MTSSGRWSIRLHVISLCVVRQTAAESESVVSHQRQGVVLEQHGDDAENMEQLMTAELQIRTHTEQSLTSDRSHSIRGEIADRCCLLVNHRQVQFFDSTPKSPLPLVGQGLPSNTMCHWTQQVYLPNGI